MFEELITKIAGALREARIPYMIIGGQAILLYGEPRLTKDIDITVGVGLERLPKIIDVAKQVGLEPIPKDLDDFVKKTYVLPTQDINLGVRVDFIFSYTPYERQAIERANKIKVKERMISFASLEDVIIHKIFAGRARDIEDVKSIILKNPNFDKSYIRQWLKEFGHKFLARFNKILRDV